MSTTAVGPKYPGSASSDDWSNFTVARLGADDSSYASISLVNPTPKFGSFGDFGFALPSGVVLTKLKATIEHYRTGGSLYFYLDSVETVGWKLGFSTSPYVESKEWTTNLPTVAQLNASSFDGRLGALSQTASKSFYVDYLYLEATYYTPATVTTDEASDITGTTATCGGETTDDGSGTIATCGVCWNTTGSPTIADLHTTDDSGIGTFTSSLTDLWPSTTYYVRSWATTEDGTSYGNQVSFTTSASASRSLVARPFTTRAAAAEFVARQGEGIIDWWIESGVVRAEIRPTDVADIPRDRWYVVSHDAPGTSVSVKLDAEDTPDIICVVYRTYGVTNVRDGSVRRVYYPGAPTSATERVKLVDLTGQYMGASDASTYAKNVWDRTCAEALSGSVTARGGLHTVDGAFQPAPLILAGDWLDIVDIHGHTPTYITGTTFSHAEGMVTITLGGSEQTDLVIPGISALPAALTVYGQAAAYETTSSTEDEGHYDSGLDPPDPGIDPNAPSKIVPKPYVPTNRDWGYDEDPFSFEPG